MDRSLRMSRSLRVNHKHLATFFMSQLTLLQQLQSLDDTIRSEKTRLADVMKAMEEPQALVDTRTSLSESTETLANLERIQRDLELQHGSLETKYKASHDRMYSGKVKNSRELSDLEKEVGILSKRKGKLEDDMLENLMMVEEASEAKDSAETTLAQLETDWKDRYATLNDEKLSLATKLGGLLGKRKSHVAKIDAKYVRNYMDIAKKRRGLAVVKLDRDQCGGCRTKVSQSKIKVVAEGQIAYCGSCGRILC